MTPSERMAQLGRRCRHYNPRGTFNGDDCLIGHPISKIVFKANGNSQTGMAYMLPCRPGPERKAEYPNYDPRTDEEIAAREAEMQVSMNAFVAGLPAMNLIRATMIAGKIARKVETCPWCNGPRLHVTCAVDFNNHLSAVCEDCGREFRE